VQSIESITMSENDKLVAKKVVSDVPKSTRVFIIDGLVQVS